MELWELGSRGLAKSGMATAWLMLLESVLRTREHFLDNYHLRNLLILDFRDILLDSYRNVQVGP